MVESVRLRVKNSTVPAQWDTQETSANIVSFFLKNYFNQSIMKFYIPDIKVETSCHFKGNGYIELNRSAVASTLRQEKTGLAILFSTTQPDGLLIWYGQNKGENYNGQDFMSLAIVNGNLEYSFRLNGEESLISPVARVDDNNRHVAIIKREGNQATLELDFYTSYGEIRPTGVKEMFLPGHVFIGGAPDLNNFTGNRYKQGFHGCIHIVENLTGGAINLSVNAVSAANLDVCPE